MSFYCILRRKAWKNMLMDLQSLKTTYQTRLLRMQPSYQQPNLLHFSPWANKSKQVAGITLLNKCGRNDIKRVFFCFFFQWSPGLAELRIKSTLPTERQERACDRLRLVRQSLWQVASAGAAPQNTSLELIFVMLFTPKGWLLVTCTCSERTTSD